MKTGLRVFLWLAGVTAGLVILVLLVTMFVVRHSEKKLADYKAELERRGERFDLQSLEPAPARKEGNGGPALLDVARKLAELGEDRWELEPEIRSGRWVVPHKENLVSLHPKGHIEWAEAERRQVSLEKQLADLIALSHSSTLELDIHFDVMPYPTPREPSWLDVAAHTLAEDACLRLRQRNVPGAVANIETMLKIALMVSRHPAASAQNAVTSIIRKTQLATWEVLQVEELNPEELKRLQTAWESFAPLTSFGNQLRYQRAGNLVHISTASGEIRKQLLTLADWRQNGGVIIFLPWLLIYQSADTLNFIQNHQEVLDAIPAKPSVPYAHLVELTKSYKKQSTSEINPRLATRYFSEEIAVAVLNNAEAETWRALTITAIALRRYQLDHQGRAPADLETLVPKYLAALPHDPFGDGVLRYRTEGGGFLLYSVGDNLSDEGGEAGPYLGRWRDSDRKDIVWPRAAAEEKP